MGVSFRRTVRFAHEISVANYRGKRYTRRQEKNGFGKAQRSGDE